MSEFVGFRWRRWRGALLATSLLGVLAIVAAACVSTTPLVPLSELPPAGATDWASWYQAQTGGAIDDDFVGVYSIEPVGDDLYLGLGGSLPNDINGSLLARYRDGSVTVIGQPYEQGFADLEATASLPGGGGPGVLLAGADPRDSWRAGNLYQADGAGTFTKFRHRIPQGRLVARTTTDADGQYSFDGLTETMYQVRFIPPAGTKLTTSIGNNRGRSAQTSSESSDPVPGIGYAEVCGPGIDQFTPWTNARIDAGLVPGTSTIAEAAATPDADGFAGASTVAGRVWNDADANGQRDAGETSQAGATVELWSTDPYLPCHIHGQQLYVDDASGLTFSMGAVYGRAVVFIAPTGTNDWEHRATLLQHRAMNITRFAGSLYLVGYTFPAAQGLPPTVVMWRSTDDGFTWAPVTGFSPDLAARPLEFNGQLVSMSANPNRIRTIDADGTVSSVVDLPFTRAVATYDSFALACPNGSTPTLYASDEFGGLWRTVDLTNWIKHVDIGAPVGAMAWWEAEASLVVAERGGAANVLQISGSGLC